MQFKYSCGHMKQRKKILVPVKPASNHGRAMETALSIAKDLGADLHFISILPEEEVSISKEQAIAALVQNAEICSDNKIRATFELINTDKTVETIGQELAKQAEKCDLVVMGHTQYDPIYRFLHRSPTVDLINKISRVPVLVIPNEPATVKKHKV